MYRCKEDKKRLSMVVPVKLFDRLERDSVMYGVAKSAIVQNALINYYNLLDAGMRPPVSSGKATPEGGADTP